MFKVLGISSSPRRGGNSETLLDKALEGAASAGAKTQKIALSELSIAPCLASGRCQKDGSCPIGDDMQYVYRHLARADGIIIASPVYFGSVTAQLKAMIDRCQSVWVRNYILKHKKKEHKRVRRGVFICVSSFKRRRFFKNSNEIVNIFFMVLRIKPFKELYVPNLSDKGDVLARKGALKRAFEYGKALVV